MALSAFLPWMTAHALLVSVSRNAFQLGNQEGFSADGLVLIVLGLLTVIIGVSRLMGTALPRYMQRSSIVTGVGALIVVINRAPSIHDLANQVNSTSYGIASATIGYGVWVAGLAGIIAIIGGVILRSKPSLAR